MGVKSLLYLHCNYFMILAIWYIPVQFQLQLTNYQVQKCESIGHVGVDLSAQHKIVHV